MARQRARLHRLLVGLLLLAGFAARAAVPESVPRYLVDRWTSADGLPVNGINALQRDALGYLWLATFDGLVRFDGQRFEVLDVARHPGLGSNRLFDVVLDGEQRLWVSDENGGLSRQSADGFVAVGAAEGLSGDRVAGLLRTRDGAIVAGSARGPVRWAGGRFEPLMDDADDAPVQALYESADGCLWSGDANGRVLRHCRGRTEARFELPMRAPEPSISGFAQGPDGTMYVVGWTGVHRIDGDGRSDNPRTDTNVTAHLSVSASFVHLSAGEVSLGMPMPIFDAAEGNGGTRTLTVPLRLNPSVAAPVTLNYALMPANGSAGIVADDLLSPGTGTVTFAAGSQDATLVVQIVADNMVEPDEDFILGFAVTSTLPGDAGPNAALDATLAAGTVITLRNDDSATLTLPDVSGAENGGPLSFVPVLSAPVQLGFNLSYGTVEDSALSDIDYIRTFDSFAHDGDPATGYSLTVPLIDDTEPETDETFLLYVEVQCNFWPCPLNVIPATGTILDDDTRIFRNGFE